MLNRMSESVDAATVAAFPPLSVVLSSVAASSVTVSSVGAIAFSQATTCKMKSTILNHHIKDQG